MNCPRCGGLVVQEYLLNPREGYLSGFHGLRCLNCGAIHDDVIHMNQRVSTSLNGSCLPSPGWPSRPEEEHPWRARNT